MLLINCEVTLDLIWSANCVIYKEDRVKVFAMTHTKLYVPVATLLAQDNGKLLQQLKLGFKRTINWNKNLQRVKTPPQN